VFFSQVLPKPHTPGVASVMMCHLFVILDISVLWQNSWSHNHVIFQWNVPQCKSVAYEFALQVWQRNSEAILCLQCGVIDVGCGVVTKSRSVLILLLATVLNTAKKWSLIGNHIWALDGNKSWWPWVTLNGQIYCQCHLSVTRVYCDKTSEARIIWFSGKRSRVPQSFAR